MTLLALVLAVSACGQEFPDGRIEAIDPRDASSMWGVVMEHPIANRRRRDRFDQLVGRLRRRRGHRRRP